MRLTFLNQPLSEVGLRLSFEDVFPLTPEFVVDFGNDIEKVGLVISRSEFIDNPPGVSVPALQFFERTTLAGVKISYPNGIRVYLQENMIGVRWKSSAGGVRDYPRFPALLEAAEQMLRMIEKLTGTVPRVSVCNLFYQNIFSVAPKDGIFEYLNQEYLPSCRPGDLANFDSVWKGEPCEVRIHLVASKVDSEKIDWILETSAGKVLGPTDNSPDVSRALNVELNRLFGALITERTKSEWQLQQ